MNDNDNLKNAAAALPELERHPVLVLSGIYLDAGLPLEAAVRSAIADYECTFEESLKAS